MNKRQFLQASGALLGSGILSNFKMSGTSAGERKNWAGNYEFRAPRVHAPESVDEVRHLVKSCTRVKALGTKHSFNNIADSAGDQISTVKFKEMTLDPKAHRVTVGAGVKYGELAPYLDGLGFALHNLASLPHISVAGARSTATHGSGVKNGNLATAVAALEFVTAEGEVVRLSRDGDGEKFRGAVVDLGAMGVVTKVTLDVQPTFQMKQMVYERLPFSELKNNLDAIFGSGYSVSLFTDWQNHQATQVWIKSRVGAGPEFGKEFYGAKAATRNLHPLAGHSAENCTEQMGVAGPWYERMPHFRMNFTPSSGAELQSEFFVPRSRGYEALLAVEKLREHVTPHLFITELRTIAADDLWMSPCYKRDALAIHFTWKPEWAAVKQVLPLIETALEPFEARPHWAKLYTMGAPRLRKQYEQLGAFRELVHQYDPGGKFRNEYLDSHLLG